MNLNQFLKQVDSLTEKMPKEELAAAIRRIANDWPESERQDFLKDLETKKHETSGSSGKEMKKALADIEKKLDLIEQEELCLNSKMNEEYDDWYNSAAEEFFFFDPEHVTDILEDAFEMAHSLMDHEMYEEAYSLSRRLLELQVQIDGDYADYVDPYLNWKELRSEKLISIQEDRFIREMLYAAYQVLPLQERVPVLFWIMQQGQASKANLEMILQTAGGKLPQMEEFLGEWIKYLGTQDGNLAGKLLKEALEFLESPSRSLQAARSFASRHPELYEDILQKGKGSGQNAEMLSIGFQALEDIQVDYKARSRVALLTAEYALHMGSQEKAEFCWLEAFRSDPGIVNFLRLMTESRNFEPYQKETMEIYLSCRNAPISSSTSLSEYEKPEKRSLGSNTYYALEFFNKHFDQVLTKGMNISGSLGWSSTFMKEGIALFLLSLYPEDDLPPGCQAMCRKIVSGLSFDSEKYSKGLILPADTDSCLLFMKCLTQWKKGLTLTPDQQNKLIKKLENWIEKRVEGIMEANRRNYYGECASFIAALGEVKESMGEKNGKERLMETYANAYPRRRSFHEELRRFGMRDMRKSTSRKR